VVLRRLFQSRPALRTGAALYEAVTRQARDQVFYRDWGVPDTVEGRFELYSLHVILLLGRLSGQDAQAAEVRQALFDAYLRSLDDALRDMGVGDLSVGKKMRKLGEAFYGRAKSYEQALSGDDDALGALIERTVYADVDPLGLSRMVDYVRRSQAVLATQPLASLYGGQPAWAEVLT